MTKEQLEAFCTELRALMEKYDVGVDRETELDLIDNTGLVHTVVFADDEDETDN
jgi:hypothetical protein